MSNSTKDSYGDLGSHSKDQIFADSTNLRKKLKIDNNSSIYCNNNYNMNNSLTINPNFSERV